MTTRYAGLVNPAAKALWFIESHFDEDLTLEDIASAAGVSRFHLSRIFGIATGHTVGRYVRGRRLTEAARKLAGGAPDILALALDAGYGSHEAFTRAFRDRFGITPEQLRASGSLGNVNLTEPIRMDDTLLTTLETPRFEQHKTFVVAGLSERCNGESIAGIAAQWQRFVPHIGHIPGQVGCTTYGLVFNGDSSGNFDYMCAVEVSGSSEIPAGLQRLQIPESAYAVFTHSDHISTIRRTWFTILNKWLPESGYAAANTPEFELYDERFDPRTGNGSLEIWIPIRPKTQPSI